MLAAPNRSRIRAVVEHAAQSADTPPRWSLRLRLEAVEALYGGTFVHEGEVVEGFAFDLPEQQYRRRGYAPPFEELGWKPGLGQPPA